MTYFTRKVNDTKKDDFEKDFRDIIVAWCFVTDFDINVFNKVQPYYHRIVRGKILNCLYFSEILNFKNLYFLN